MTLKTRLKRLIRPSKPAPRQKADGSLAQLLHKAGRRDIPADRGARERETSSQGSEFNED